MAAENNTNWQPIVTDGPRADAVRDALQGIARDLQPSTLLATDWQPFPGLASGCSGLAVLYGYLARTGFDPGTDSGPEMVSFCEEWLEHAIDGLASTPLNAALHGGFTGVAWASEHLENLFPEPENDDAEAGEEEDFDGNEEIEDALLQLVRHTPWTDTYDLIGGLAGFGIFCLERGDKPGSRQCLHEIVDRLEERATVDGAEVTWFTPPEELIEWQREREPQGYHNLGVAHGIPALMGLLSAAVHRGVNADKARFLLDGSYRWLWQQTLPPSEKTVFPHWISPVNEPQSSRLAWCYGDIGLATTLLAGQRLLDQNDPRTLDMAKRAAECSRKDSSVADCGLCHGSAGAVQLFNRLYQSTRIDLFRDAALKWVDITLEMKDPEMEFGGFWSQESKFPSMEMERKSVPGFLTGSAGVALALLATMSDVEPGWDRSLMMSL